MDRRRIRPIVICLFRRGDRILVCEAVDTVKGDHFCRPHGGGIEFGEHSRDALEREIREETGAEIVNIELVGVLENIFIYEGEPGHEVIFVYDAEFRDKAMYDKTEITVHKSGIDLWTVARWLSIAELEEIGSRLVPEGLAQLMQAGQTRSEPRKPRAA